MTLSEYLKKAEVETISSPSPAPPVDGEIEKLAELLEAYAEEDTLVDELAKLAVVADFLERTNGQKRIT